MDSRPPRPPASSTATTTSCPSSTFHSAAQSPSSLPTTPNPFADPPIYPLPSITHSVEQLLRASPNASTRGGSSDLERHLDAMTLSARVRTCDVYLGLSGRNPLLLRFVKWLRAELEMHGIPCFVSDRGRCRDARAHGMARAAMDAAAFGVVVLTGRSFSNPYCIEEARVFSERRRLVPVFFGLTKAECNVRDIIERRGELWERNGGELWSTYGGLEEEWTEAVRGLSRIDVKIEANSDNFRDCISETVALLGVGLGRRSVVENVSKWKERIEEEIPFPRNLSFVGRKKEILDLERLLFGDIEGDGKDERLDTRIHNRHTGVPVARRSSGTSNMTVRESVMKQYEESKGKEPMVWKDNAKGTKIEKQDAMHERKNNNTELPYETGIVCVSGDSGIGKTELLLEFAYRYSQRYKRILWVGGEARYIHNNYMKLLPLLGVDVTVEDKLKNEPRSFEDMEQEAIRKVQKELLRDVPFLLVIDNLESEKDWWNGKSFMELLPHFGRETHVIISTRLPRIVNIESLRLLYLSRAEAMSLMKGALRDLNTGETDALRLMEEKLGRLPLGLALVGAIISELPMIPSKLLDTINRTPFRELRWSNKEDIVLKHNPFLIHFLDICFSIFDRAEKPMKFALRMVQASGWFGPAPIPTSILAVAACEAPGERQCDGFWRKSTRKMFCTCKTPNDEASVFEDEAASTLIRFRIARNNTKTGYISFHEIIKFYVRRRGNGGDARLVVQAISINAYVSQHADHIWAVCFLLFKFGSDPVAVTLSATDLISFIRRLVMPLALHTFSVLSRCNAAMELLRRSSEALEVLEESFLSKEGIAQHSFACLNSLSAQSTMPSEPLLYRDLAHLRATLLEARAKLMLRGGLYDIGEQLCRTALNIKEVMYGREHSETQSTRETMERLIRFNVSFNLDGPVDKVLEFLHLEFLNRAIPKGFINKKLWSASYTFHFYSGMMSVSMLVLIEITR